MAIDTATKRRAVIQLPGLCFAPVADGFVDVHDRRQAAYIYPLRTVPISFALECWPIEKRLEFKAAFKALTLWSTVKPLELKERFKALTCWPTKDSHTHKE